MPTMELPDCLEPGSWLRYIDLLEGAALAAARYMTHMADGLELWQALTNLQESDLWAQRYPPAEGYDEQD